MTNGNELVTESVKRPRLYTTAPKEYAPLLNRKARRKLAKMAEVNAKRGKMTQEVKQ